MDSISKELNRMYELNKKLIVVFRNIGFDLLHFADEYNYPIPPNMRNYFDEAEKLIIELNHPTSLNKKCSLCSKLNPENAEYCCYCGSSMIITHVSPDVLHGKRGDSNHPKSDSTCNLQSKFSTEKMSDFHAI